MEEGGKTSMYVGTQTSEVASATTPGGGGVSRRPSAPPSPPFLPHNLTSWVPSGARRTRGSLFANLPCTASRAPFRSPAFVVKFFSAKVESGVSTVAVRVAWEGGGGGGASICSFVGCQAKSGSPLDPPSPPLN